MSRIWALSSKVPCYHINIHPCHQHAGTDHWYPEDSLCIYSRPCTQKKIAHVCNTSDHFLPAASPPPSFTQKAERHPRQCDKPRTPKYYPRQSHPNTKSGSSSIHSTPPLSPKKGTDSFLSHPSLHPFLCPFHHTFKISVDIFIKVLVLVICVNIYFTK